LAVDPVEVINAELDAGLARDSEQMQHRVRGPAGRRHRSDGVLQRLAGDICLGRRSFFKRSITSLPHPKAISSLRGSIAGTPFRPIGEMPRNSNAMDIVFAVNWPPHAPAPGHA